MLKTARLILMLTFTIQRGRSANILLVNLNGAHSHHIWIKVLIEGLLQNGHNITMLTHEHDEQLPTDLSVITIEGFYKHCLENFPMRWVSQGNFIFWMFWMYTFVPFICEYDFNSPGYQRLLDYPRDFKFDLIIFNPVIGGRCNYPLLERFGSPPGAAITPFLLPPILQSEFGGHVYSSYQPFYMTHYSNQMSLWQRLVNFVCIYSEVLHREYVINPQEDALIRTKFPELQKSPDQLEADIDLLLCNLDPVLDYPVALPPNIIPVGGLHARPSKPLPKDLKKIMDEAPQGVVLFSLGTKSVSSKFANATRRSLLEAFARLPQVVLWKFEANGLENVPENVVIRRWFPQNDILGHPNIKLFVNHGGAMSTQEAVYHGVPVVGIPSHTDQFLNVRKMEEKGIAKCLDATELTVDNIYSTLDEVLTSPKYRKNAGDLSRRYRDQPQSALSRAVFWIEYLLRHGTAKHLVSPARNMPFYQTCNLDVLAALVFILTLVYYILKVIGKSVKNIFSQRRAQSKEKAQ